VGVGVVEKESEKEVKEKRRATKVKEKRREAESESMRVRELGLHVKSMVLYHTSSTWVGADYNPKFQKIIFDTRPRPDSDGFSKNAPIPNKKPKKNRALQGRLGRACHFSWVRVDFAYPYLILCKDHAA
jgi:hypothetical protein